MTATRRARAAHGVSLVGRQICAIVACEASHSCSTGCYTERVSREVSVRDLRNHTGDVVAAVRGGERVSLTVNRMPVADIVPHAASASPWVPSRSLRAILGEASADEGLLDDLAAVREDLVDDA